MESKKTKRFWRRFAVPPGAVPPVPTPRTGIHCKNAQSAVMPIRKYFPFTHIDLFDSNGYTIIMKSQK